MLSVWMSVLALKDTRPYYGTLRTLPTEHGRRLQAPEAGVPANYFAHRSRAAIGSTLGRRWFCSPNPDPSSNPEPKPTPHPSPSPSPSSNPNQASQRGGVREQVQWHGVRMRWLRQAGHAFVR